MCPVVFQTTLQKAARAFKKGETLDYISCFVLHFFRAQAASYKVLCNRTEHWQGFFICFLQDSIASKNVGSRRIIRAHKITVLVYLIMVKEKLHSFRNLQLLHIIVFPCQQTTSEITSSETLNEFERSQKNTLTIRPTFMSVGVSQHSISCVD